LDLNNNVSWKGLNNRVRIGIEPNQLEKCNSIEAKAYFLGYVENDDGLMIADPILKQTGKLLEKNISQSIWVEGKVPSNYNKKLFEFRINIWEQNGFEDEKKIATIPIKINITNFSINLLKKNSFTLDLWQHPSNWARMYHVPLWSEEHWDIIKNYLKELASLGQKTITGIVSEMPWCGQECYKVSNYPSNLFEHTMVVVKKKKNGEFICDFNIIDRYIETSIHLGICEEIELFGLIGVWDNNFGKPIKDYSDAIRIRYFDENSRSFKYLRKKEKLKEYILQIFNHFIEKKWWNITKIICDEPLSDEYGDIELFCDWIKFLNEIKSDIRIKYKVVFTKGTFIDRFKNILNDWVPDLQTFINYRKKIITMKNEINKHGGKIYWYVCCIPDKPNNFIVSPLIENRLISWFTYYFGLDGFLRWDYAIWPNDPWRKPSYKFPAWKAGDMFFVYPGNDGKPIRTIRWENLRFGIQDFQLFLALEERGYDIERIRKEFLQSVLGDLDKMESTKENVKIDYSLDYLKYEEIRVLILKKLEEMNGLK